MQTIFNKVFIYAQNLGKQMAEQVTGSIGQEQVVLNNAASEATLCLILEGVRASSKEAAAAIDKMAARAGIDSKTIEAANTEISKSASGFKNLKGAADSVIPSFENLVSSNEKITKGNTQASGMLTLAFGKATDAVGTVATGLIKLAQFQEETLTSYRSLSQAGINFGGSLTDLRMAAAESYLTLGEFSKIMKENSESFARMGRTANDGAIAFSRVGKELVQSDIGTKLMAMGYTTEEVNRGLANYISMSGGRSAQEMKNTKDLSEAAGEYLTALDDLTQITGKNRQSEADKIKQASSNEAYQSYLLTLDEEGKKKANIAMAEAMVKGGKGATEALQAQLMGLPPITKAAKEFTDIAPKMAAANSKMADAVNDASKGVADVKKAGDELSIAANQTKKDLGKTGDAIVLQGGNLSSTLGVIFGTANRNAQQGVSTLANAEKQRLSIEAARQASINSKSPESANAEINKSIAGFKNLKGSSGIDSKIIESANTEINKSTTGFKNLKNASDSVIPPFSTLVDVVGKLTQGTAQASDLISTAFSKTSGIAGLLGIGLLKLAQFQEETLTSYRNVSKAGVNFGGSLTDLRMSAATSYMTLTDFSEMIKKNSATLANMGGSANEGAKSFVKLSNSLLSSSLGSELMSLGYTASDVNQGMLDYISITGGRTREELKDSKAISAGTAGYLEQLDRLADITGKSRDALAAEFKQKQEAADLELYKAGLSVEDREKFAATYNDALAKYGQGAADNVLAQAQGRAVTTDAGKKYAALAPMATQALREQYDATQKYGAKSQQAREAEDRARLANRSEFMRFSGVLGSATDILKGNESAARQAARDTTAGITTQKALNDNATRYDEDKKKREASQAKAAADTEMALKKLGQSILAAILPIIETFQPILNVVIQGFAFLIEKMLGLKTIVVGLTAAFVAYKSIQLAIWGAEKAKQVITGGLAEAFKKTSVGQLGTKLNPMYVIIVGSGPGGLGDLLDGKGKSASATRASRINRVRRGREIQAAGGGLRGSLKVYSAETLNAVKQLPGSIKSAGSGLQTAIKGASVATKAAGIVGSVVSIGMLFSDIAGINKKEKAGEITKEEASKQKGGAVGEGVGGLAGAAGGAALGAAMGSVVPVIGTAIGGIVGSIIGGFGGGWAGKKAGEAVASPADKLKGMVPGISTVSSSVWNIVSWPFKQLGNLVTSTVGAITGVFKGMVSGISTIFTTIWDIISWPFKQIGGLVTSVFEGISGAIKWVTDKLSNVLGMIGGVIKGITGFFGRMFGGGDAKTTDKVTSSPEFTKATSVLFEASTKMNVAADKLIVSAGAIGGKTPVVNRLPIFDKALSLLTASTDRKEKDATATSTLAEENIENNTVVRGPSSEEKTVTELAQLNKTMQDILRYMKDTADNTKKNIDATRALNGNLFSA